MPVTSQKSVLLALSRYSAATHMGVARFACEHDWHLNCEMAFTGRLPEGWRGDGIITVLDGREDVANFVRRAKVPAVDLSVIRPDIRVARVSGDHLAIIWRSARRRASFSWSAGSSTTRGSRRTMIRRHSSASGGSSRW